MKRTAVVLMLLASLSIGIKAAVRGDVKVLEATDTIRYRINDFTKNYLLYYLFPQKIYLKDRLAEDLRQLDESFRVISVTTEDAKTKSLLAYFAYEKTQLNELLEKRPEKRDLSDLILMSETFSEGADTIARRHAYKFSENEKMFMQTRSMRQGMEKILKYYIAETVLTDDPQLPKKLDKSIKRFDEKLGVLKRSIYSDEKVLQARERIDITWRLAEKYLKKKERKTPLPLVLNVGGEHIESSLNVLGIYYSKTQ